MLSAALSTDVTQVNEVKAVPAPRTKLPAPRYVVRHRDGLSAEHRTPLGAMKAARALVQTGHRGVLVIDRRDGVAWRPARLRARSAETLGDDVAFHATPPAGQQP